MKPIFEKGQYVGLDMESGPNVDVVGVSHDIPFIGDEFDIVISSSCFEHDDMFWVSFQEMCRVLKNREVICIFKHLQTDHTMGGLATIGDFISIVGKHLKSG